MVRQTFRSLAWAAVLGVALPLGASAQAAAASPSEAVKLFFTAASDSNLKAMSQYWGNAKGSAAATSTRDQPTWERRLIVMQTFLIGVKVKPLTEVVAKDVNSRGVTTELARGECKVVTSIKVVKAPTGWVVTDFDLSEVSAINRGNCGRGGGNP